MNAGKVKIIAALFFTMLFTVSVTAQTPKITSLVVEPLFPHYNYVTLQGENISSTPIIGEFNPGWQVCRPCSVGTEIPLSVNRTRNANLGAIYINGSTNLVIGGVPYSFAVGWLDMTYNVPSARIIKGDQRKRLSFAREAEANMRITLWRNGNEFPNATPILDQTLTMHCTAHLSLIRYRNSVGTSWLYDTKSYKWICTAID